MAVRAGRCVANTERLTHGVVTTTKHHPPKWSVGMMNEVQQQNNNIITTIKLCFHNNSIQYSCGYLPL